MERDFKNIDEVLTRYLPTPSEEDIESDAGRILHELRSAGETPLRERIVTDIGNSEPASPFAWQRFAIFPAVAAIALAVFLGIRTTPSHDGVSAVVENAGGGLYRTSGQAIQAGETLQKGQGFRTNGGTGAVFRLTDGSRVEMRSKSELKLASTEDGVVLDLTEGSIIVTAAKQHGGHLYVKTRDVLVSVVGTVFLVNAEEAGSRVAVIEGEVQVRQGKNAKTLLPGEQTTSDPRMKLVPVRKEIEWSRNAEAHLALLQKTTESQLEFEVNSVRPSAPPTAAPGVRGGPLAQERSAEDCIPSMLVRFQVDPRRFAAYNADLRALIMSAYGKDCMLLSGGPDWIAIDRYDVEATIPAGSTSYTVQELKDHAAPKLQAMLQTLLATRFKLLVHTETREAPAYNLVVVKEGKLKPAEGPPDPGPAQRLVPQVHGRFSTHVLASMLTSLVGRPVTDKTDLKGMFDVHLEWSFEQGRPDPSSLLSALQEQLGLKLEAARSPVEFLVIDRAEKPAEN